MHLHGLELRRIAIELVTPFRTSFGTETERDVLLVRAITDVGDGWGECVAMSQPLYSDEFVDAAQLVISGQFWPELAGLDFDTAGDVTTRLDRFVGHPMAKAAVEAAVLDAQLRHERRSFGDLLGSARDLIPSGVSVGIFPTIDELLEQVQGYVDEGYQRIKIKIETGWDIEPVGEVRSMIGPELALQVDANAAYGRTDIEHLRRLDEFDLLLIEQPLATDDLLGHAQLAEAVDTPICLDESIVSVATAADAIALGAAEIINIKAGRVGGYLAARRIHDLCLGAGVPVWCGGMLETGIGRAANAALASLPGFTLPGDISASTRFFRRDIVLDPISVEHGHVRVPEAMGMGFDLDHEFVDEITTSIELLTA